MKKIITICAFAACLTGCDDFVRTGYREQPRTGIYVREFAICRRNTGKCLYTHTPCAGYSFNDVATDDAVSNDAENSLA